MLSQNYHQKGRGQIKCSSLSKTQNFAVEVKCLRNKGRGRGVVFVRAHAVFIKIVCVAWLVEKNVLFYQKYLTRQNVSFLPKFDFAMKPIV